MYVFEFKFVIFLYKKNRIEYLLGANFEET